MINVDVYNFLKDEKKPLTLNKEFFDIPLNKDLIYQVVRAQSLNLRSPIAHTKTRGEVRGGGKKPWAQKYTGRARHGSIRSPIWVGGGVVFGPRKERSYKRKINRKTKNKALFAVLSEKLRHGELIFTDKIEITNDLKTKNFKNLFDNFLKRVLAKDFNNKSKFLIVTAQKDQNLKRVSSNLPRITVTTVDSLSALLLLSKKYIILTQDCIEKLLNRKFTSLK